MNTWRRTALMTAILAATIPAAQAVDSVVLENTTYQTVNEPDKHVVNPTNNTAIVEDGRFVAFNVDLDTGSVLILNSDDAQITTTGNFHLGTGTIKRSETENLKNLTFTGGDMTIAGGSLTVDGTLTWNSLGGYTAGYLDVRDGGDLTVDTFVASSYYSLKSSANSTVTVRDLQSVGMVRNDGGIMNIRFSFKGSLYVKLALVCAVSLLVCTVGINSTGFYFYNRAMGFSDAVIDYVSERFGAEVGYFGYLAYRLFFKGQIYNNIANYALLFAVVPLLTAVRPLKIDLK